MRAEIWDNQEERERETSLNINSQFCYLIIANF